MGPVKPASETATPASGLGGRGRGRIWKAVGWVLGLGLTAGALWFAAAAADWEAARRAPPAMLVGLVVLVLVNLWATAGLFWSVTLLFPTQRHVGLGTMTWLISVSAVLNYIPVVRAGLWGRAGYLKVWHGLRLRDSAFSLVYISVVAGAVLGVVAAPLLAGYLLRLHPRWGWLGAAAALVALQLLFPVVMRRLPIPVERHGHAWVWSWVPLRLLDLAAAVGRVKLSFAALGVPLGWTDATLIGTSTLIIRLVGITPNGLGLAEWVTAALADVLTVSSSGVGVTAALIDRAAEMAATLAAGLVGGLVLWFASRRQPRLAPDQPADSGHAPAPREPVAKVTST